MENPSTYSTNMKSQTGPLGVKFGQRPILLTLTEESKSFHGTKPVIQCTRPTTLDNLNRRPFYVYISVYVLKCQ